eukprot:TRINITY_DN78931_c0_g1_i1.p1 TRINITY_DN78931_c0_g1~~TRINITY_DN78931_c0_g1_i1.p1  ORF type:complete len:421 (+),score=49.13 TRINITY_DN78931_c0_g1_i1:38-1300(+)
MTTRQRIYALLPVYVLLLPSRCELDACSEDACLSAETGHAWKAKWTTASNVPSQVDWMSASYEHPRTDCEINGSMLFHRHGVLAPGECRDVTTKDSRIWGPSAWYTLHVLAHNWPDSPSQMHVSRCVDFVESIATMVPCGGCGYHAQLFDMLNEANNGVSHPACFGSPGESTCQSAKAACSGREKLIHLFVRHHNFVSNFTRPCRQRWSSRQAQSQYAFGLACTSQDAVGADLEQASEVCNTKLPSRDVQVFGPSLWRWLNIIAVHWPGKAFQAFPESCVKFLQALPYMVPSEEYKRHFRSFERLNEALDGASDLSCFGAENQSRCQRLQEACAEKDGLLSYFTRLRNYIESSRASGSRRLTVEQVRASHSKQHLCAQNIWWHGADEGPFSMRPQEGQPDPEFPTPSKLGTHSDWNSIFK